MLRKTLPIGLAILTIGCAQPLSRPDRAVQQQIVQDRMTEWARAFNSKDLAQLATFYHQDLEVTVAWPDGRRTRGWDEESVMQEQFFLQVNRMNLVLQDPTVRVFTKEIAIVTFRHSDDIVSMNTDRDIYAGQGTMVWQRGEDDIWRIRAQHLSRDPGGF